MNKDKQIFWLAGITILILIILPYLNLGQKFAISDSDWVGVESIHVNPGTYIVNNQTITFPFYGQNYSLNSGNSIYYTINGTCNDNSNIPTVYSTFPSLEGTNRICRLQLVLNYINATPDVLANTYSTIYTKEIQTVEKPVNVSVPIYLNATSEQICLAVKGIYSNSTCTCPNNSTWSDSSTNKVCAPVINTVTNNVEPTFFEKYGIAGIIFIVMGLIIIYLIYKRTR